MLRFYNTKLKTYIQRYQKDILERVTSPTLNLNESMLHTKNISECARGNESAKEYMITYISNELEKIITQKDYEESIDIIINHLDTFNNFPSEIDTSYEKNDAKIVSYFTFAKNYFSKNQKDTIKRWNNYAKSRDIRLVREVLTYEIYRYEYGLNEIEDFIEMDLNNIEVHGTSKIRIEAINGIWYTIDGVNFDSREEIKLVASRLVSQNSGADLTLEDCEREFMLLNGCRGTIALAPASYLDHIFIKKFESFDLKSMQDLVDNETLTEQSLKDIEILAKGRANILVGGGVNVGKSTFFRAYNSLIPGRYKIGMVDSSKDTDIIKMYPDKDIVILYETEKYTLQDQFIRLLRMNRHILSITEVRSYEAYDLIKAMTRANRGSGGTLHFSRIEDAVDSIGFMILESGKNQSMDILRQMIANAIDIVFLMRELPNGKKALDKVAEIVEVENSKKHEVRYIYKYSDEEGRLLKQKDYKVSPILEENLRYNGVSSEEIARLNSNEY